MKESKVLIFAFLLSIAVHTAILITPNFSRPKVKQIPLVMHFQFVKPTFKTASPKKMASKPVTRKKFEESKKINKSHLPACTSQWQAGLKNPKKEEMVKPLQKKMSPTCPLTPERSDGRRAEKLVPEPKEKENISEAGIAMATELPKSIDIPLQEPSGEKVTFEQNNITPGADILAAYLNQIRLMLEKEKRYPFLARKNNWEGTVYIKFTILRDGGLKKIKVTQSSGFEILDKEAKATIGRTSFPALPKDLQLTQLQLEVPIVFHLIK
ncbi:MAG: hypothetical protein AMJ45_04965 [Syntrophobacter sp. DG_60]|nr:MAG: hypothetical protein AMJ45_04965 [Syntrophobacter sp. DG_60]